MRKSILVAAFASFLLLGHIDALGCSCSGTASIVQAVEKATLVFSGEVIRLDMFRATFKVEKMWKGEAVDEVVMFTGTERTAEGYYTESSCDYGYTLGEKYLVYAYGPLKKLKTHFCSRTRILKYAEGDVKELERLKINEEEREGR